MTETNLVLIELIELMKMFQASLARIERKLDEHTTHLGRIETSIAGTQTRIDRMDARIERLERLNG